MIQYSLGRWMNVSLDASDVVIGAARLVTLVASVVVLVGVVAVDLGVAKLLRVQVLQQRRARGSAWKKG
jgi:hypothetical protein